MEGVGREPCDAHRARRGLHGSFHTAISHPSAETEPWPHQQTPWSQMQTPGYLCRLGKHPQAWPFDNPGNEPQLGISYVRVSPVSSSSPDSLVHGAASERRIEDPNLGLPCRGNGQRARSPGIPTCCRPPVASQHLPTSRNSRDRLRTRNPVLIGAFQMSSPKNSYFLVGPPKGHGPGPTWTRK